MTNEFTAQELAASNTQDELKCELNQWIDTAKEYTFGMGDASLYCTKVGFFVTDSMSGQISKYQTYNEASGKARMIVAKAKSWK